MSRYTLAGRWWVRGVNILEDARHRIGLLQYNLSTATPHQGVGKGSWWSGPEKEGGAYIKYVHGRCIVHILYRMVFGQKKVNKKFADSHRIQNYFLYIKTKFSLSAFPEIFLPQFFLSRRGGKNSIQENKNIVVFFYL